LQQKRELYDASVTGYAGHIVDDREVVSEIYNRLLAAEERLVPGFDYHLGSARVDDEVLALHGLSRALLTAEHATIQMRKGKPKEADAGTGALAEIAAQDTNSTAIIAAGRQTSDANYTKDHPFKDAMAKVIEMPDNRAHIALHMLDRGRASDPAEHRGYSIMLGIGNKPSEATLALKDELKRLGSDMDLKVGVNAPYINFDKNHRLRRNDDGSIRTFTFAAAGPNTTRTFSQDLAEHIGKDAFAALQIEINEVLLARQNDEVGFGSDEDRHLGAYLGYLFVKEAVKSVKKL
jgi:hypothetical protein